MSENISLGDFVKQLVAELHLKHVDIPFENQSVWHELFYELKQSKSNVAFLQGLRFDWDGSYPKCQTLSRFLHALHWNAGVSAYNPEFRNITLSDEMVALWQKSIPKTEHEKVLLSEALSLAEKKFSAAKT